MKRALNLSIVLLALTLVYLIAIKVSFTGAVIGAANVSNVVYFPIVLLVGGSLIALLSFKKWAYGGLAALVLAGGVAGMRKITKMDEEFYNRSVKAYQEEFGTSKTNLVVYSSSFYELSKGKIGKVYTVAGLEGPSSVVNFYTDENGALRSVFVNTRGGFASPELFKKNNLTDKKSLEKYEPAFEKIVRVCDKVYGQKKIPTR